MKYCNGKLTGICYDQEGSTRIYKDRPPEKLEGFRMTSWTEDTWPTISGLKEKSIYFQDLCKILTVRLFKALGRGRKPEDVDLFVKKHEFLNKEGNPSQLKFTYYPPITGEVDKGSLRIAEHSDFGSITLLFHEEDGICGFQTEVGDDEYLDVKQVPHGILLTVGDQLKFLTGRRLRDVKHRVIVPENENLRSKVRKSIFYGAHVDDKALLEELEFEDGKKTKTDTVKSLTGMDFLIRKLQSLF